MEFTLHTHTYTSLLSVPPPQLKRSVSYSLFLVMTDVSAFGERRFHTSADTIASGSWVTVQKKTFTKWWVCHQQSPAVAVAILCGLWLWGWFGF